MKDLTRVLSESDCVYKACKNSLVTLRNFGKNNEGRCGVVDPRYAKFRCAEARVVLIEYFVDHDSIDFTRTEEECRTGIIHDRIKFPYDRSIYDENFVYTEDFDVSSDFDEDINKVCAPGIHYFKDREAAISYYCRKYVHDYAITDPSGIRNEWYDDGQPRRQIHYKDRKFHGKYTKWWENGKKEEECEYVDNQREGVRMRWHENGQMSLKCKYKHGKLHGRYTKWDREGNVLGRYLYFRGWKL